jgi:hypothetical protein
MSSPLAGQLVKAGDFEGYGDAFTSFIPTWTNVTVGNGAQNHAYLQMGKLIIARYELVFGSTSAITGTPVATLPVTGLSNVSFGFFSHYRDVSAPASFDGIITVASTTTVNFLVFNPAAANANRIGVTSTTPMTWANGDMMQGQVIYEAA